MEWLTFLLILLCPLMMIFCMKGMMGSHKHHGSHQTKDLDTKLSHLQMENEKLRKEVSDLSSILKKGS